MRDRQPDPAGGGRPGPSARGRGDARSQRPPGQPELRGPRTCRVGPDLDGRRPGPAGDDRRVRRTRPLRDHRNEEPRTEPVLRRGAEVRKPKRRQTKPRPQPLPRPEPDQPRGGLEADGRVPGFQRIAQRHQDSGVGAGLPGVGRTGGRRQADAEMEPRSSQGWLEESGRRSERGRTPDRVPGLGQGIRPPARRPPIRLDQRHDPARRDQERIPPPRRKYDAQA